MRGRKRQGHTAGGRRGECANAIDDDDRADCERDADAQRDDRHIRLSVAAGLERLIPTIEQLHDRRAEADGENRRDDQSSHHFSECNTRVSSAGLSRHVTLRSAITSHIGDERDR